MLLVLTLATLSGIFHLLHCATLPDNTERNQFAALPDRCGMGNEKHEAQAQGSWPWIVRLGYRDPDSLHVDYLCGGSLITDRHVLTAAHCVYGKNELATVRYGEFGSLSDSSAEIADIAIASVSVHESFDPVHFYHDIAILNLNSSVPLAARTQPICLPTDQSFDAASIDQRAYVAGWGASSYLGPSSGIPSEAQLTILSAENCLEAYKNFPIRVVSGSAICAGNISEGQKPCQGDAGGPLMYFHNGKFHLLGVRSFSFGCDKYPRLFVSVADYLAWILRRLK